jgi:hypothetical protein
MAIVIYTGLPRQGKTLNAVYDIINKMRYGRKVITNTPIWCYIHGRKVVADFYDDPDRFKYYFLSSHNATLFCDEASLYFSSLRWNNLGMDFFAKFRQAGKQSCDLYCTSQSWVDTVNSLRRIADTATVCTKRHWIIPVPILDFRHDYYNAKWGFYERRGWCLATPLVYYMKTVNKGFFTSKAELPQNRQKYILNTRVLYPSTFREYSKLYDHEYQITSSAVAKLKVFGKGQQTYEQFQESQKKK